MSLAELAPRVTWDEARRLLKEAFPPPWIFGSLELRFTSEPDLFQVWLLIHHEELDDIEAFGTSTISEAHALRQATIEAKKKATEGSPAIPP
jgi:hypothetical protein